MFVKMKIKCFSKRKLNVRISKTKIKCAILGFSQNCCILGKSRKKLVKFSRTSAKFWQILQHFVKNQQTIQQFLTKELRLESGAKREPFYCLRMPYMVACSSHGFYLDRARRQQYWVASCGCLCAPPGQFSRGWTRLFSPPWFSWFLGFDSKTVQRSAFCRSRRELSMSLFLNLLFETYSYSKFQRIFTCKIWRRYSREGNGPLKVCRKLAKSQNKSQKKHRQDHDQGEGAGQARLVNGSRRAHQGNTLSLV